MENIGPSDPLCPNCEVSLPETGKFCPNCGVKREGAVASLADLFRGFASLALHFDNQLMKVLHHLFIPAQVSLNYFKGKTKMYPPPIQLFFVCMFFFLWSLQYATKEFGFNVQKNGRNFSIHLGFRGELEGKKLVHDFVRYTYFITIWKQYDALPDSLKSPDKVDMLNLILKDSTNLVGSVLDSLSAEDSLKLARNSHPLMDSVDFKGFYQKKTVMIACKDWTDLASDSLVKKYNIQRFADQALLRQVHKLTLSPKALGAYYLGTSSWTILAVLASMAGVLRLFFRKKRPFYVQNLIYQLHTHSAGLLVMAIGLAVSKFFESTNLLLPFMVLVVVAYGISLYRFYGLSKGRALLSWLILTPIYLTLGLLFLFIGFVAALLLF